MPFNIKATVPWDYSVDSINNGGNTLIALDKPEFRLQEKDIVVFVASVGDYFKLDYGSALTADNITIVNLAGGTGRWIRLNIENITWQLKTNWTLDSVSGNDENPGWGTDVATADATPLKTLAEWKRRTKGAHYTFSPVVHILNDISESGEVGDFTGYHTFDYKKRIVFWGEPQIIRTSTFTSVTAGINATSTTTPTLGAPWKVTDTSITTSWSNLNGSGLNGVSSFSNRTVFIRSGNNVGIIMADLGSKTASVSWPGVHALYAGTGTPNMGPTVGAFTNGSSYTLYKVPKFVPNLIGTSVNMENLEFLDSNLQSYALFGSCSFLANIFTNFTSSVYQNFVNCCSFIQNGVNSAVQVGFGPGGISSLFSCYIGGEVSFTGARGITWTGLDNTFFNSGITCYHDAIISRCGALHFYGSSDHAIKLENNSSMGMGSIDGDYTGFILWARDGGCYFYLHNSAWAINLIQNISKPYIVNGIQYDRDDISISDIAGCGILEGGS